VDGSTIAARSKAPDNQVETGETMSVVTRVPRRHAIPARDPAPPGLGFAGWPAGGKSSGIPRW
jgi:hypothetical protein